MVVVVDLLSDGSHLSAASSVDWDLALLLLQEQAQDRLQLCSALQGAFQELGQPLPEEANTIMRQVIRGSPLTPASGDYVPVEALSVGSGSNRTPFTRDDTARAIQPRLLKLSSGTPKGQSSSTHDAKRQHEEAESVHFSPAVEQSSAVPQQLQGLTQAVRSLADAQQAQSSSASPEDEADDAAAVHAESTHGRDADDKRGAEHQQLGLTLTEAY